MDWWTHTLLRSGVPRISPAIRLDNITMHDREPHRCPSSHPAPSANSHCFAFMTLDLQSGHIGSMQLG